MLVIVQVFHSTPDPLPPAHRRTHFLLCKVQPTEYDNSRPPKTHKRRLDEVQTSFRISQGKNWLGRKTPLSREGRQRARPSFGLSAALDKVNPPGVKEHVTESVNATAKTRIEWTNVTDGGELWSGSSSQDSIGAQSQRTTYSSQSNSYDQTRSIKIFPAVSRKSIQISSARSDNVGKSNSPDNSVSYTPTEQINGHVFNSFPSPVEKDISRDHTLRRTDSDVGLASLQPPCASEYDKKFHGMNDIKKFVLIVF